MRQDGRPGRAWQRRRRLWPPPDLTERPTDSEQLRSLPPEERELARFRRASDRAGRVDALADALELCLRSGRPAPTWLTSAILAVLRQSAIREHDAIDLMRAETVDEARDHGLTWERAYQFAADYLQPTEARGSPAAMKKSRQTVGRRARQEPGRYVLTLMFCRALQRYEVPPSHSREVIARYQQFRTAEK
jgi:hypothetical protein